MGAATAGTFGFDLLKTSTFSAGHPQQKYAEMRKAAPMLRHEGSDLQPAFWVALDYELIRKISLDANNFTSTRGFRIPTDKRMSMDPKISAVLSRFMLAMDDPEHATYRGLVSQAFTPANLAAFEPSIRQSVADLVDGLKTGSEVEFVTEVGAIVPIRTVCTIMGVPREDEARVFEFTNAVFGTDDADFSPNVEVANRNYLGIFDYANWLFAERRREPKNDVATMLVHAEIDGKRLNEIDLQSFFSNMISAGNETTRSSLSGAVWALSVFPDQRRKIVEDPSRLAAATDEILRWYGPVYHMARVAKQDLELAGETVRAGERVALLYGAGNYDPAVFEDPFKLDVTRPNASRHVTFGYGVHHCLGFRLGNLQLRMILEAFLRRFPNYEVLTEPVNVASNFVRAIKSLRVRLQ